MDDKRTNIFAGRSQRSAPTTSAAASSTRWTIFPGEPAVQPGPARLAGIHQTITTSPVHGKNGHDVADVPVTAKPTRPTGSTDKNFSHAQIGRDGRGCGGRAEFGARSERSVRRRRARERPQCRGRGQPVTNNNMIRLRIFGRPRRGPPPNRVRLPSGRWNPACAAIYRMDPTGDPGEMRAKDNANALEVAEDRRRDLRNCSGNAVRPRRPREDASQYRPARRTARIVSIKWGAAQYAEVFEPLTEGASRA